MMLRMPSFALLPAADRCVLDPFYNNGIRVSGSVRRHLHVPSEHVMNFLVETISLPSRPSLLSWVMKICSSKKSASLLARAGIQYT
jgi:hypothetical protein